MKPKERLLTLLEGGTVDRMPAVFPVQTGLVELMERTGAWWPEAHWDPEKMAKLALAAHEFIGIENVRIPFCITVEAEALGSEVSKGTIDTQPRITRYVVETESDIDKLEEFDLQRGRVPVILKAIKILSEKVGDDLPIIVKTEAPSGIVSLIRDPVKVYRDLVRNPGFHVELQEKICEFSQAFCEAMLDAGADILFLIDTQCCADFMGLYEKYMKKSLIELLSKVRCPTILHVCSKSPLYNEIATLNVQGVSLGELADITEAKRILKDKIIFGNVSCATLYQGTPEEIEREAMIALKKGVDVLCPACGLSPRTPVRNAKILVDISKSYGSKKLETL